MLSVNLFIKILWIFCLSLIKLFYIKCSTIKFRKIVKYCHYFKTYDSHNSLSDCIKVNLEKKKTYCSFVGLR